MSFTFALFLHLSHRFLPFLSNNFKLSIYFLLPCSALILPFARCLFLPHLCLPLSSPLFCSGVQGPEGGFSERNGGRMTECEREEGSRKRGTDSRNLLSCQALYTDPVQYLIQCHPLSCTRIETRTNS